MNRGFTVFGLAFWDVVTCSLVIGADTSEKPPASIFRVEDGDSRFL
jgi:hypothetical protein